MRRRHVSFNANNGCLFYLRAEVLAGEIGLPGA